MAQKRRSMGDVRDQAIQANQEQAREQLTREFSHLRDRFSLADFRGAALEHLGEFETARDFMDDFRDATGEVLLMYRERGFDVNDIGREFDDYRGLEGEGEPELQVNEFFDHLEGMWSNLEESVVAQAEDRAEELLQLPEMQESVSERISRNLGQVWRKRAEDVILGSRGEEVRARLGLRTFPALCERWWRMEEAGSEEAMPRAYAWTDRAYWLTKHSIRGLQDKYPEQAPDLQDIGLGFEQLGEQGLARGESQFPPDTSGWDVINPAKEVIQDTWRRVKETITPKD
ncbi:MAG: hypothetical protein ABH851_01020 [Methanobacteriota archaeon]